MAEPVIFKQPPLHQAVLDGDADAVRQLLAESYDANQSNVRFDHPLHLAASSGNVEVASLLIDAGADVHATDYKNNRPLHFAAGQGDHDMIRLLLDMGADPNARNTIASTLSPGGLDKIDTPAGVAFKNGDLDTFELLIEAGSDHIFDTLTNTSYLQRATRMGDAKAVERILDLGVDVDHQDKSRKTAAHYAADKGNVVILDMLKEEGADMSIKDYQGKVPDLFNRATKMISSWSPSPSEGAALHDRLNATAATDTIERPVQRSRMRL